MALPARAGAGMSFRNPERVRGYARSAPFFALAGLAQALLAVIRSTVPRAALTRDGPRYRLLFRPHRGGNNNR